MGHPLKGLDQEKKLPHRKRNTFSRAALQPPTRAAENGSNRDSSEAALVGGFTASLGPDTFALGTGQFLNARETFGMSPDRFRTGKLAPATHKQSPTPIPLPQFL